MKLADLDIKKRLTTFKDIGLSHPISILKKIRQGEVPPELPEALTAGKIIVDPLPDLSIALGGSTLDLEMGTTFEVLKAPYEIAEINGETVIRPFVVDCHPRHANRKQLSEYLGVTEIDQSWIRFSMSETDVFELPVHAQINAFTKQIVCIPHDLEGKLDGRSQLARKGITSHVTSDRFDAGFCGFITLEIQNGGQCSFNIRPGTFFCSLGFVKLSQTVGTPYYLKKGAKFSGQA